MGCLNGYLLIIFKWLSSLQPRRGRGRGAEILRAQSMDIPPGWSINASSFVAQPFTPLNAIGPKEIPSSINA